MQEKVKYGCVFNIQKFSLHDGPGIRSVIFFKGCPLNCYWCSNPEAQKACLEQMRNLQTGEYEQIGEYMTSDEIIAEVIKDIEFYQESGGGVTLSGGEVLTQAPFAIELLQKLKALGIHTACETTGYTTRKVFEKFITNIDTILFDVKHYDPEKFYDGTGAYLKPILENLELALSSNKEVIIRIPVIPTFNDSLEEAEGLCSLLHDYNISKVEFLPFHQFGENKYESLELTYKLKDADQLHKEDLVDYLHIFEKNNIAYLI